MRNTRQINRGRAQLVGSSEERFTAPGSNFERRDSRLPPPSQEPDDYTVGLLGSEGTSFTVVKLTRDQLRLLLSLEDKINAYGKSTPYAPEFVLYRGGIRNAGTKEDPVWEPKGERMMKQRIM